MTLRNESIRRYRGYGLVDVADAYEVRPQNGSDVAQAFELARQSGRTVCLRGQGRSYGDASLAAEQISLDLTDLKQVVSWDPVLGILEAEAGLTIAELVAHCLPTGWWCPVVPGTAQVTLGGALAMNVHGKNQFSVGSLAEHVIGLSLMKPDGTEVDLTPDDPDFAWVIGSAGLLGVITRVRLQMRRVASGLVQVTAWRSPGWTETLDELLTDTPQFDYLVGWLDMFRADGRAVFHGATYQDVANQDSLQPEAQRIPPRILGLLPRSAAPRFLRFLSHRSGMRLVNAVKGLLAPRNPKVMVESLTKYSFLLDSIPEWRSAYRNGFAQVQLFIPREHAAELLPLITQTCLLAKREPFLAVLKRHRADRFPLSWALDGVSLAMDFPYSPDLAALCSDLHRMTLGCGGKFYLAKDRYLTAEEFALSLGQDVIEEFLDVRRRWDPEGLLATQLAERLGLL